MFQFRHDLLTRLCYLNHDDQNEIETLEKGKH